MSTLAWIVGFLLFGGVAGVLVASLFLLVPAKVRSRALPLLVAFATGALLAPHCSVCCPRPLNSPAPTTTARWVPRCWVHRAVLHSGKARDLAGTATRPTAKRIRPGMTTVTIMAVAPTGTMRSSRAPGAMLLVGETIHNMLDGVLIAAAFLIDINLGVMTGLAVLAHEVPSEVGNFAVLLNSGLSRRQAFRWNLTAALGAVCGGIVGYFALSSLRPVLPYALAVSAASLLYVAVADLIPGLHRRVEPRSGVWQVLLIAAGVALVASVEYFLPH